MRNLNARLILLSVALILSATVSFALPACPSDQTKRYHNCFGTYTHSDGDKYVGEWRDDKFNGQGTLTFPNGEKYVGEFKDNKYNGQGTLTFPNGEKYVGEWRDEKKNGQGTHTWPDGEKYVGEWKDNKYNGQGTFTFPSGEKYVGEFKDNKYNGQGTLTFANGTVWEGIWKDDEFQYARKNPNAVKPSPLKAAYIKLSKSQREQVQSILSELGFYKSSIDGLYGKGTAAALKTFNKQNLKGADLSKRANVSKLMTAVLAFEPSPSSEPKVIQTDQPNKTYKVASGTGFYVSSQGHIITNHHVIDGCRDMKAHSKGRVLATLQIAADKQNDLALLKIAEAPSHVFALSNDSPYPLQEVIVAGFPFGDKYSSSLKFTQGIVSSLTGMGNNYSEIQIDAALQQGNSGGPIIDEYGNIIAVAVAKLDAKYMFDNFGIIPENTNFGVKASAVRNLMEGNGVLFKLPNTALPSRQELSKQATDGTVFLTCWMTMAQVEKLRSKKVMFEDLE